MEPFEASLPADLHRLRGLRHDLAAWLERIRVPEAQRDAVVLAVHEAAANGIEHAGGAVSVRGARDEDKLIVVVTNGGSWTGPSVSEDLSRGRGLALMRGLTSNLDIAMEPQRTTVRMRIDLQEIENTTSRSDGRGKPGRSTLTSCTAQ